MSDPDPDILDVFRNQKLFGLVSSTSQYFAVRLGQAVNINDPKKKGCVAVRILGVQPATNPRGQSNDDKLHWAQTAYATNGDFHLPSVGDVGFIVFLQGDFRQPVWVGTLIKAPNGSTELPVDFQQQYDSTQTKGVIRGFVTSAGSKFIVTDKIDDRDIVIETPGGRKISVRDNAQSGSSEKKGVTIDTGSGYSIKINEEDNKITIDCPSEIKISAGGNVTVEAGGDAIVKSAGTVQLGDATFDPTDGCVTGKSICPFTGIPHADVSSKVLAKKF